MIRQNWTVKEKLLRDSWKSLRNCCMTRVGGERGRRSKEEERACTFFPHSKHLADTADGTKHFPGPRWWRDTHKGSSCAVVEKADGCVYHGPSPVPPRLLPSSRAAPRPLHHLTGRQAHQKRFTFTWVPASRPNTHTFFFPSVRGCVINTHILCFIVLNL